MEKDINNGEWGYHFYYEDPHLPEQFRDNNHIRSYQLT